MKGCNEMRIVDGCLFPRGRRMRPTELPLDFLTIVHKDWRTTNKARAKGAKDDGKINISARWILFGVLVRASAAMSTDADTDRRIDVAA
jgi:hypothetical protein